MVRSPLLAVEPEDVAPAGALTLVGADAPPRRSDRAGVRVDRRDLIDRLERSARVTLVSAPAGSGKTFLLRQWVGDAGLADRVAWVSAQEGSPRRFWLSVLGELRGTEGGSTLVRDLTPAPDLDGAAIVERLLEDLDSLEDPTWLVIDDLHELRSDQALHQLELFLTRAPAALRLVLSTRHDLRLGLHRLRLEGGLTEIRARDLRFSPDHAQAMLTAAGVEVPDPALTLLLERTEGWAAGLRLAALSLAGHPDPHRFATEFSGSERTVAEYLLAEVLERQPEEVRRLLLRTSVLDRVSGPLADHLTGDQDGERILYDLEKAGTFVVGLDAGRSWFRYHHLFADLLRLELRRTEPSELPGLHRAAADWFVDAGYPVEAVRHAQAAGEWSLAARLLCDHWTILLLDGQQDAVHRLLVAFPAGVVPRDPELVALTAADELNQGSLEDADRHLAAATSDLESVPAERRGRFQVTLGILRLCLARQRGDLPTVAVEAQRLLAPVEADDVASLGMSEERRALALISLGVAETWSHRIDEAEIHLDQGVALARQINRPYLELLGLAHGTRIAVARSYALGAHRGREAIELAERHGWGEGPITGVACAYIGDAMLAQGQLDEAERWLGRAERTLRPDLAPAAGMTLHWTRGALELARGDAQRAVDSFRAAEALGELLLTSPCESAPMRARALQALLRLGHGELVEAVLAEMDEQARDTVFMRSVVAARALAVGDPEAASVALAPVIGGTCPPGPPIWRVEALVLEAIARDAVTDTAAAHRALGRALDLADPDGAFLPFFLHPAQKLLERHVRRHPGHTSLVAELLNRLGGKGPSALPGQADRTIEPLSESEIRVLRYLPTNLSLREIGNELYVSVHTVKTHAKHIYGKLGVHSRGEAVELARVLGLLAPSPRERRPRPT